MLPSRITLALIVRNEARCVARCLSSVKPWVGRMVVLDTGSTDDTATIARDCGAEVHHWHWRDDFAAARNQALALADADWTLFLDADEWIQSGGEQLSRWTEGPPRLGVVCIHSEFDEDRSPDPGLNRAWMTRLLPRGARYQGRVHEQVLSKAPRERLELHLGHDGYRSAQMAHKHDRNRPLLLLDLRDHPEDPYVHYQLGKDAEVQGDFRAACRWYAQAARLTPPTANWRHELTVRQLHCLGQAGLRAQALALAEDEMPHWAQSPDFFFVLGNLLLDQAVAEPVRALDHWLPLAEAAWRRCLEIGERPDLEGSVHGRGSHLARHNLDVIQAR